MARIKVPAALAGGASTTTEEAPGDTVGEVLENHADTHGPELYNSVVEEGELKEFINVFVEGNEVKRLDETVGEDDLLRVMPAASGG